MKKVATRILFPFYTKRHSFLMTKWWFRFLVVTYVVLVPIAFVVIWNNGAEAWEYCFLAAPAHLELGGWDDYEERVDFCGELLHTYYWPVLGVSILITAALHYLVQLLFFVILVNFVILGPQQTKVKE